MCYKDEKQKKYEELLQNRFDMEKVPYFIQNYFINIESKQAGFNYYGVISDLLNWTLDKRVIDKNSISEITPDDMLKIESEDVTRYFLQREKNDGISPTTLQTRKNIFKSFWNYLVRTNKCPVTENIITYVKYKGISPSCIMKKLPSEQMLADMEEKIKHKKDEFVKSRNLIVLRVLKGTGIRESELAGLDLKDVVFEENIPDDEQYMEQTSYITVLGKRKYREVEKTRVYLTGDAERAIREWLVIRDSVENIVDKNALFLNKNGKRLTEENIKCMFRNYGNGITPHMIRHWYATVFSAKAGIVFVQQQLGHKSDRTTVNNYINGCYGTKAILKAM